MQYENKSYRMFVEWLLEAYYLWMFMQLSNIPHYTTLQKFAARVSGTILENIISSFVVLLSNIRRLFIGIMDSSGFKLSNASLYYANKVNLHKKYLKLSTGVEVLSQIVCSITIRRAPRHDTKDFRPLIKKISEILPPIVSICC
jgi:hypothetical protein